MVLELGNLQNFQTSLFQQQERYRVLTNAACWTSCTTDAVLKYKLMPKHIRTLFFLCTRIAGESAADATDVLCTLSARSLKQATASQ